YRKPNPVSPHRPSRRVWHGRIFQRPILRVVVVLHPAALIELGLEAVPTCLLIEVWTASLKSYPGQGECRSSGADSCPHRKSYRPFSKSDSLPNRRIDAPKSSQ